MCIRRCVCSLVTLVVVCVPPSKICVLLLCCTCTCRHTHTLDITRVFSLQAKKEKKTPIVPRRIAKSLSAGKLVLVRRTGDVVLRHPTPPLHEVGALLDPRDDDGHLCLRSDAP